jgi:hypothetical protein
MDNKELNRKIDALGKRNEAIEGDIQALGLECVKHTEAHGDTGPMNRLVNVLRRGQHKAFVTWALTYGKFVKNFDKVTKETQPLSFAKAKVTDIEGATENPWFTFADAKDEAIEKAFDLSAAVKALIKRAAGKVGAEDMKVLEAIAVAAHVSTDGLIPTAHKAVVVGAEPALV